MIIFIKSIIEKYKNDFFNFINVINYRRKFPNSKVSLSSKLYDIKLSGYNVLFENVILVKSFLGVHTYIQRGTSVINASIGKFCSIAPNVSIGPGIHKLDCVSTHPSFYLKNNPLAKTYAIADQFNPSKKTIVGHDVWIGERVVVIDGVTIGTGAVIAAGAVVTKDVEPYSIVGGVPAKHIKYRFNTETIAVLLNSEWWNNTEQWFDLNYKSMYNIVEFKNKLS
jgi:acetyltransferase-like isoleucine patch superfamily enzyme